MDIFFALLAGLLFAIGMVVTRIVLDITGAKNEYGALVTLVAAGLTSLIIAFASSANFGLEATTFRNLIIIGVLAPGLTQITYFISVKRIGPARAGIFVGLGPIWAVIGGFIFTDVSLNAALIIGVSLGFAAGALLGGESTAAKLSLAGILAGLYTGLGFGARDVVSNHLLDDVENLNSALTSTVLWLAGVPLVIVYVLATQLKAPNKKRGSTKLKNIAYLCIPGVLQGAGLTAILQGFKEGRLEIVAPISNSMATVGVVVISAIVLGKGEWNIKVLFSMVMIVVGAVLVGVFG